MSSVAHITVQEGDWPCSRDIRVLFPIHLGQPCLKNDTDALCIKWGNNFSAYHLWSFWESNEEYLWELSEMMRMVESSIQGIVIIHRCHKSPFTLSFGTKGNFFKWQEWGNTNILLQTLISTALRHQFSWLLWTFVIQTVNWSLIKNISTPLFSVMWGYPLDHLIFYNKNFKIRDSR